MFKLQPNPTFSATIQVPVPGSSEFAPLPLTFRHKGRKALEAWIKSAAGRQDLEFLLEVVEGWGDNVVDETGAAKAFSPEAFDKLLDDYPAAGNAIFEGYLKALTEARRGN